jgi:tetratricopeptide (TPR) repeat protein
MITPDKRFFASYAREDRALAQPVLALLRAANPDAFLELDAVHPANRWPQRLAEALAEATTFIIFWSRHALSSEELKGEWQSALSAQKEVVTVLLDATPLPEPLQAHPSVELQDLATMKRYRGGRTPALLGGIGLLLAAAAVPVAGWQLGLWAPDASFPFLSGTGATAPASTRHGATTTATPAPATAAANVDRENRLRDLLSKGRQLRESGDSTAALAQFQEAAQLDDKNPVCFVEMAVTEEAMGLAQDSIIHWRKVHELGTSAGLYFSLAEAKLRAANALPAPGETTAAPEDSPDLTKPVEGVASGSLLGLLPISREDQLDGKSAARFVLHIPVKVRPKAQIDVHELIIHVLFYEMVDGKRIEETAANVKSHWLNPPANWVGTDTEQLEVEYQLPKPPTAAETIVDRKYYGYIIRVYYKELLQAAVADPVSLAKLHPAPPTVNGEPVKPPAPKQTPAPLPQGAFHQGSSMSLTAPVAGAAAAAPGPTLPPDDVPGAPAATPLVATVTLPAYPPLPWILSSVVLLCLAVVSFVRSGVARRRHQQFDRALIELAARRLAATLSETVEEEAVVTEETPVLAPEASETPQEDLTPETVTGEEIAPDSNSVESEPAMESLPESNEALPAVSNEGEQTSSSEQDAPPANEAETSAATNAEDADRTGTRPSR